MTTDINHIFNHSSCLTSGEIEQYVSGTLSEKNIRRVELHLADCSMCSDELDGYLLLNDKDKLQSIVSDLNNQIDEKIFSSKQISLHSSQKSIRKRIFSIAASLILLLGVGFIINFYIHNADKNLAEVLVPVNIAGEESVLNKSEEIIKSNETEVEADKKKGKINDTKTVNTALSEKQDKNLYTKIAVAEENDKNEVSVSDVIIGANINEEEVLNDNETLDEINLEDVSVNEKKSGNTDVVISGLERNNKIKSEREKPKEEIAFMTTRGVIKNRKTADKKEVEKYTSLRESALLSYKIKIWDEALKDFIVYLKYKPNDFEIIYKSGVSYYNLKKYDKAVSEFDKVIKEGINRYVENAEWYEAKSLVKIGKNDKAKILLNNIIVKNGKYQNQALDLLNSLE